MMAATKTTNKNIKDRSAKSLFIVAALNMTWQLAAVVLIPVIGGFKLDQKFNTLPALTIIGFITAMACMVIVVNRQLEQFGPPKSGGKA